MPTTVYVGGVLRFFPGFRVRKRCAQLEKSFFSPRAAIAAQKSPPQKKVEKKKWIPFLQTSTLPATLTADRIPRCVRSLLQGGVECTDTSDENIHVESVVYHGQKCNDFEVFTVQIQKFIGSNCDVLMYAVVLFLQKHNKQL